ncbi:MAG: assimilatory sulfite reductase (NADPH) flavoprotein subunit [Kiritimatiellae bacterium]|jgi:sulfite reductase (NADPH) flavoprotein alpha-component|nr:assimilatory sulfite reductase (NADPH) flavoprotein subunit [Kiritimatiellia bacterium]
MSIPLLAAGVGPLSPEQQQALNSLLSTLSPDQASWLCGYLAGVNASLSGTATTGAPAAAEGSASESVTVLFGSQTGNSEGIAGELVEALKSKGVTAQMQDMGTYKTQNLKQEKNVCVVVSTHGEGDPPDTAMDLHAFINGRRAPKMDGISFSVLALGDTSYEHFCKTGKDFDQRFLELGGTRLLDRVDCDVDYEDNAETWERQIAEILTQKLAVSVASPSGGSSGSVAAPTSEFSKKNPFPSPLLERINLNGRGSAKETLHMEFDLEGSGLTYQPGDALGVVPSNDSDYVDEVLEALDANPDEEVVTARGIESLRDALMSTFEITTITRPFLRAYSEVVKSRDLSAILEDNDKLNTWLYGREIIDVLTTWPAKGIPSGELLEMLRKLPPRLYSIASSLNAHPDEVHLCVGVTRYEAHGRIRKGVCSTYLADRVALDETVRVYVDANKNFKLPATIDTPVIMVGPGTGIAPFRAFVEERELHGDGKNWLFFGEQHFDTDFLYQTEWQQWLKNGVLDRVDVAFSRDQKDKLYVQDRMREQAKSLYAWLEEGAHFYVCGDESRMAHDVHQALIDIIQKQGGKTAGDAENYLKQMQKDRRYQRDVY